MGHQEVVEAVVELTRSTQQVTLKASMPVVTLHNPKLAQELHYPDREGVVRGLRRAPEVRVVSSLPSVLNIANDR